MRYRMYLAEDEEWIRKGIKAVIDWDALQLELAGEAADGADALRVLQDCPVDILMTDIRMPGCSGIELAERALQLQPQLKVIFVSGYKDVHYFKDALRLGAVDYLLKPIDEAELGQLLKRTLRDISRQQLDQQADSGSDPEAEPSGANSLVCVLRRDDNGEIGREAGDFEDSLHANLPDGVECSVNRKTKTEFLAILYYPPRMDIRQLERAVERSLAADANQCLHAYMGEPVTSLRQLHLSYNSAKNAMFSHRLHSASRLTVWGGEGRAASLLPAQDDRDRLLFEVENGGTGAARVMAEALIGKLVAENPGATPGSLMDAVIFLSFELIRLIHRYGIAADRYYERCAALFGNSALLSSWPTVAGWLGEFAGQAAADIGRSRESDAASAVNYIRDYVQANYWRPLQLGELAREVHLNPAYLSAYFKRSTGRNFSDFLIRTRMESAAKLLRGTTIQIGEVARSVGYEDMRHFSRLFKKYMGATPSAYREEAPENAAAD